jgi:hypothetical protein
LEQQLLSLEQNMWLKKMLGYDYEIIYKKGKYNIVADALSRQHEEEGSLFYLSLMVPDLIEEVHQEWITHQTTSKLIECLKEDPNPPTSYTGKDNIICYKDLLVISPSSTLKPSLLNEFHSSSIAGHLGFQKTYGRARHYFFWGRNEEGYASIFHKM